MNKPTECWILTVKWDDGSISKVPCREEPLLYPGTICHPFCVYHPITNNETWVMLQKAKEVSVGYGSIQIKPKGNPLNDLDHYDDPEN